ncbi:MAG TPA: hypothetical protein ENF64_00815, partial [Hadesarchaea archaeon]|nr:hypothetical protein [Hadesarchaea archaeon]
MKVEILEKMENPLLGRTELKFKVDHTGAPTPRRLDVRSQLSAILGVGEDLVVIEKITSSHGRQVASGIARVYGSKERLEKIEPKYLLRRVPSKGEQTEKSSEEQKTEKLEPTKEGEAKPESK